MSARQPPRGTPGPAVVGVAPDGRIDAIWRGLVPAATLPGMTIGRSAAGDAGGPGRTHLPRSTIDFASLAGATAAGPATPGGSVSAAAGISLAGSTRVAPGPAPGVRDGPGTAGSLAGDTFGTAAPDGSSFAGSTIRGAASPDGAPGGGTFGGATVSGGQPSDAPAAAPAGDRPSDFHIEQKLASGGMGDVFVARQVGLDRTVALKRPRAAGREAQAKLAAFVREGTVTGDLEHPNIVPVYQNGIDADGLPFYAMKLVKGIEWRCLLHPALADRRDDEEYRRTVRAKAGAMRLEDQLEILLRVCDAVAFAHSRHVIHRDLKPENVMVGDFGEVQVMDWGLALDVRDDAGSPTKAVPRSSVAAPAGTPAYMAPEMALAETGRIGVRTDVYLLGAMLYEILTGSPPHVAPEVMQTLYLAATNVITEPADAPRGLARIAMKALRTAPSERHADVQEFQADIREYLRHAESVRIAEKADRALTALAASARASSGASYVEFAEIVGSFRQALDLWDANALAREGRERALAAFVDAALSGGDLGLARAQLDQLAAVAADGADGAEAVVRLRGRWDALDGQRRARQRNFRILRVAAAALVVALVVGGIYSYLSILAESNAAERQRAQAIANLTLAERERAKAQENFSLAEDRRREAEGERAKAVSNFELAERQRTRAEENLTLAEQRRAESERQRRAALANLARVDVQRAMSRIEADRDYPEAALYVLRAIRTVEDGDTTEQRRLLAQVLQSSPRLASRVALGGEAAALAYGPRGELEVLMKDGGVRRASSPAATKACGPDARGFVAAGDAWIAYTRAGVLYRAGDAVDGLRQPGVRVTAAAPAGASGALALGTDDGRLILQDASGRRSFEAVAHRGEVTGIVAAERGALLLTAGADGKLVAWDASTGQQRASVRAHTGFIGSLAAGAAGDVVATAGAEGVVRVWNVRDLTERASLSAHRREIGALAFHPTRAILASQAWDGTVRLWEYGSSSRPLVATVHVSSAARALSVAFSADGGTLACLAGGNEVQLWDVGARNETTPDGWHARAVRGGRLLACDAGGMVASCGDEVVHFRDEGTVDARPANADAVAVCLAGRALDRRMLLGADGRVRPWDTPAASGAPSGRIVATATASGWLAAVDADGLIAVARLAEDEPRLVPAAQLPGCRGLAIAPDGTLAAWAPDGTLVLREPAGERRLALAGAGDVQQACFLPDRTHLVVANRTRDLLVLDLRDGRVARHLAAHSAMVRALAVDASGRWMASGGADGQVVVWDLAAPMPTVLAAGLDRWVEGLLIDDAAGTLVCLLDDGAVRRYRLARPDTAATVEALAAGALEALGATALRIDEAASPANAPRP